MFFFFEGIQASQLADRNSCCGGVWGEEGSMVRWWWVKRRREKRNERLSMKRETITKPSATHRKRKERERDVVEESDRGEKGGRGISREKTSGFRGTYASSRLGI